ncbi:hypothetical protein SAMN05443582_110118 [Phyllobacterium sp. OV277]|nr:hypothetical protein SAMN05443582_110118 [Phyllobacterium sp. OV277]
MTCPTGWEPEGDQIAAEAEIAVDPDAARPSCAIINPETTARRARYERMALRPWARG